MQTPTRRRSSITNLTPMSNKRTRRLSISESNLSYKRKKKARLAGSDHNDIATKFVKQSKPHKKERIPFSLSKDSATGIVQKRYYVSLSQKAINEYYTTSLTDKGTLLEFFTPRKFKDAEAISFNSKIITNESFVNTAEATGANLSHHTNTFVKDSHVQVNLRNVTQHNCTVEMFISYGVLDKTGSTISPWGDFQAVVDQYYGTINSVTYNTIHINPLPILAKSQLWKTTMVTFKFEPGEKQSHFIQGPKNYVLIPHNHINVNTLAASTTPTWLQPEIKGNGCYIWFRIINDLTMVVGSGAESGANTNMANKKMHPAHPINQVTGEGVAQGGVVIEMIETIITRAPTGKEAAPKRDFLWDFGVLANTLVDVQIDADAANTQSGTL